MTQLQQKLQDSQQKVTVGAHYVYYRDADLKYKVLQIGLQEADEQVCMIYQALYGEQLVWVRNLNDWLAEVELAGKKVARFQKEAFKD